MKHTPGPWRYSHDSGFVFAHDDQMTVLEIRGWGYLTGIGGMALEGEGADRIQEANGTLAAAAPDLLTTLRAAAAALRSYQYGNAAPDLAEEIASCAEALIAKAEGGK